MESREKAQRPRDSDLDDTFQKLLDLAPNLVNNTEVKLMTHREFPRSSHGHCRFLDLNTC
jgi:hypothetical protein